MFKQKFFSQLVAGDSFVEPGYLSERYEVREDAIKGDGHLYVVLVDSNNPGFVGNVIAFDPEDVALLCPPGFSALVNGPAVGSSQEKFECLAMNTGGINLGAMAIHRDGKRYVSPVINDMWLHFLEYGSLR